MNERVCLLILLLGLEEYIDALMSSELDAFDSRFGIDMTTQQSTKEAVCCDDNFNK